MVRTDYLQKVFRNYTKTLMKIIQSLRAFGKDHPFDAIAFTGVSGAAFAFDVANRLKKSLILVRKKTDDTHSSVYVEGCVNATNYVIIDDCVVTGKTIRRIVKEIKRVSVTKPKCVGIYLYDDYSDKYKKKVCGYQRIQPPTEKLVIENEELIALAESLK